MRTELVDGPQKVDVRLPFEHSSLAAKERRDALDDEVGYVLQALRPLFDDRDHVALREQVADELVARHGDVLVVRLFLHERKIELTDKLLGHVRLRSGGRWIAGEVNATVPPGKVVVAVKLSKKAAVEDHKPAVVPQDATRLAEKRIRREPVKCQPDIDQVE